MGSARQQEEFIAEARLLVFPPRVRTEPESLLEFAQEWILESSYLSSCLMESCGYVCVRKMHADTALATDLTLADRYNR